MFLGSRGGAASLITWLWKRHIHIWGLYLEDIACDWVFEFLFFCLPLGIKGALASVIHPTSISKI